MSSSASSSSPLSSSAASSLTILTANQSDDLVPGEESAVRAWLMSQGFRSGEIRRENEFHYVNEKYDESVWMHPNTLIILFINIMEFILSPYFAGSETLTHKPRSHRAFFTWHKIVTLIGSKNS